MSLRILDTGLRPARWNAAMSAALLESADAGAAPATLRLHRYPLSCVIGRNQDAAAELDLDACRAAGIEVARRVTGGGAVVMGPGVLAFDLVLAQPGMEFGRRAGEALAGALTDLGFPARLATAGSIEIAGAKVSGSAGRLGRRAALHQATLIEDLSRSAPLALLRRRTEGGKPAADPRHRVGDLRSLALAINSVAGPPFEPHPPVIASEAKQPRTERQAAPGLLRRLRLLAMTGEEGGRLRNPSSPVLEAIAARVAAAFGLLPEPGLPSPAERASAEDILARETGRDDYVFENVWSRAA